MVSLSKWILKKIIVALDKLDEAGALKIAGTLKGKVWGYKVNDLVFEDPKITS